jgi:hypothetical protein
LPNSSGFTLCIHVSKPQCLLYVHLNDEKSFHIAGAQTTLSWQPTTVHYSNKPFLGGSWWPSLISMHSLMLFLMSLDGYSAYVPIESFITHDTNMGVNRRGTLKKECNTTIHSQTLIRLGN